MADALRTYVGPVKAFFSDIAFILKLAWDEHKRPVVGLGLVRALGAVIPSVQVYVGNLIVDQLVYLIQDRTTAVCGVVLCGNRDRLVDARSSTDEHHRGARGRPGRKVSVYDLESSSETYQYVGSVVLRESYIPR